MESTVIEVLLPSGATVLMEAVDIDGGASKTGFGDRFDFDEVARTLQGLSEAIKSALARAGPSKVTVRLSVELAVKSGRLTSLVVEGQGKGALSVTMEWEGERTGTGG